MRHKIKNLYLKALRQFVAARSGNTTRQVRQFVVPDKIDREASAVRHEQKKSDVMYMMEAIEHVSYKDERAQGWEPLMELLHRMQQTQERWEANWILHDFSYLLHLYRVQEKMQQGEWSYACHEMLDVLHYSQFRGLRANALVMENAMHVLEEGLKDGYR